MLTRKNSQVLAKKRSVDNSSNPAKIKPKIKYLSFKERKFKCFGDTYHLNRYDKYDCDKMINIYPLNICKTSKEYQEDKRVWCKLLRKDAYCYFLAPEKIKSDDEIAKLAASIDFWTLKDYPNEKGLDSFASSVLSNEENKRILHIKDMSPYDKEKFCNIMEKILISSTRHDNVEGLGIKKESDNLSFNNMDEKISKYAQLIEGIVDENEVDDINLGMELTKHE